MTEEPVRREFEESQEDSEPDWVLYDEDWLVDDEVATFGARRPEVDGVQVRSLGGWVAAAVRGLLDIQFRRVATRTLLPLVYVLGLLVAVAVPAVLTVIVFRFSVVMGVVFLVVVAPLLALTIAATVRLMLEFLVNMTRLASRVNHITAIADDLMRAMSDMTEPVSQLSEDFRAVQFWRPRQRRRRG